MRISEIITTVNSLIRTLLVLVLFGLLGWGAWVGYSAYESGRRQMQQNEQELAEYHTKLQTANSELARKSQMLSEKEAKIGELSTELAASQQRITQLETSLRLLTVDHRLAHITVLDQQTDRETGIVTSKIEFLEVNDEGAPIDEARNFQIEGDIVYVDYWVVKFEDKYIERGDVERATSICLFRRIFGESQAPEDGYVLDKVGSRPNAYGRGGKASDFERAIWNDFWNIANDVQKAHEMGIRAAHGEAVAAQLRKGMKYRLLLRSSGGLSITPVPDDSGQRDNASA